jgi:hypothetical protein
MLVKNLKHLLKCSSKIKQMIHFINIDEIANFNIRKYSENLIALMFGFLPTTIIQVKTATPPFHIV